MVQFMPGNCHLVVMCVVYSLFAMLKLHYLPSQGVISNQWKCTLHTANKSTLHTVYCTLHIAHFTLHTAHCTLHTAHCTLHTAHCTLNTSHCTLHTAHCTLQTAHCTLHSVMKEWLSSQETGGQCSDLPPDSPAVGDKERGEKNT